MSFVSYKNVMWQFRVHRLEYVRRNAFALTFLVPSRSSVCDARPLQSLASSGPAKWMKDSPLFDKALALSTCCHELTSQVVKYLH